MVQGFARQSGGDARVTSVLHEGSCFELLFPAIATMEAAREAQEPIWVEPGTALVVEDNPGARTTACRALQALGLDVLEAVDASSGLHLLGQTRVDYLIANLMLPAGGNGADLAQAALRVQPKISVVQ